MEIADERLSDQTRRMIARAHYAVAAAFLLVGLLQGSGAVVAVSAFILSWPIAFWLMHRNLIEHMSIVRRMPDGQYEGRTVRVEIEVENKTWIPVFLPMIEDHFTAEPLTTKWAFHPGWLHAWDRMIVRYEGEARGPRGEYVIGPATLSISDPLGLGAVSYVFQNSNLLTVFPQVFPVRRMPFESARSRFSLHIKSTTKASAGQDFYGVRDYKRGDSMRQIHWRSTARLRRLIVKEFEMPSSKNVYLFIDMSEKTARGMGQRSSLEYSIRAAASIFAHAIETSHRVGLYADAQIPIRMAPAGGLGQLQRVMRMLVAARPSGRNPFDQLLMECLADINIDSAVVLIFPTSLIDLDRYAHAVAVLRGRGVTVSAVLIDDRTFYRVQGDVQDYARERPVEEIAARMAALGLSVYVWGERQKPEDVFREPAYES